MPGAWLGYTIPNRTSQGGNREVRGMADGSEWVKYVTERVVTYIETPKEERKQSRQEAKQLREPWLTRWFGLAPLGVKVWWDSRRRRRS